MDLKIVRYIIFLIVFFLSACASTPTGTYPDVKVETSYLKDIVANLATNIGARNLVHYQSLQAASIYIQKMFREAGYEVTLQKYTVAGKRVENIIASIGPADGERVIVGAHYDTYGDQPGADDNASGIAGLIALARLLKNNRDQLHKRVDLVAFTLEEPPFFRTEHMGSFVHANSLKQNNVPVHAMISLEMIGYFRNAPDTQQFPLGLLHLFYPDQGDFIAVISNISSWGLKSRFSDYMSRSNIPVQTLSAPGWLVGVDFSDHLNYWKFDYDAIMVTDTAFYRNHNYHQFTDKPDTLDYNRMAEVVVGVYYGVLNLANR